MAVTQFGKYQLLRRLAVGGMAEIFLSRQTGLSGFEKLVVVKRILPNLAGDPKFVEMFLDEARLAATLNHPNVVQIYDLGKEDDAYFIAMEFIAGNDLLGIVRKSKADARVPGRQVPVEIVAKIISGAAEGLHYAHTITDMQGKPLKLVHRDVSPSNILVGYNGGVKVVDFGIAKAESQSSTTQAGQVKGKFSYMSPEQIHGKPLDGRSDVFSLGIVLYEVLVGRRLFKRESELAIIQDILYGEIPPPSSLRPDVPKELDEICLRALEKELRYRTSSAQELHQDLEKFLSTRPSPTSTMHVAAFMSATFVSEKAAHDDLLKMLPTASTERVAELLEQQRQAEGSQPTGSSIKSFSNLPRSRSGSHPMPRENEGEGDAIIVRHRKKVPKAALGAAAVAVLLAVVVGVLLTQRRAAPTVGTVEVSSVPQGADVSLDDAPTGLKTPTTLRDVPFGAHQVSLTLAGRQGASAAVELSAEQSSRALALELKAVAVGVGLLVLTVDPPNAEISFDGRKFLGKSPLTIPGVEATREHLVRASSDGFLDEAVLVSVNPGEEKAVSLKLTPRAEAVARVEAPVGVGKKPGRTLLEVSLSSTPTAQVSFEGKKLGKTPLTTRLPAGPVVLTFTNPELDLNQTAPLEVTRDQQRAAFVFQKGKLAADVQPWADVYIGEKKLGTTPLSPRELYEGTYTIRLINSEIGAMKSLRVKVEAGRTTVLREKLD